ncbi:MULTISPECIES: hypothetical protein [Sphingomonas]|uniref:hypothetical protein n=1 Tax=Sphingomonas TaxID=13687 RepID=UPI000DEFAE74|nr:MULTISPECIES: hypothetical protein [Sphingomonas]
MPSFRLPRLGTNPITQNNGKPQSNFQSWINSAFAQIEKGYTDLGTQLGLIQAAQTTATTARAEAAVAATTATWSGVTGTGRPADNADVTAFNTAVGDGNRVRFSLAENGTSGYGILYNPNAISVTLSALTTSGVRLIQGVGVFGAATQVFSVGTDYMNPGARIPVRPGERIFAGLKTQVDVVGATGTWNYNLSYLDASGAPLSSVTIGSGTTDNVLTRIGVFTTVPANAYSAWFEAYLYNTGTAGAGSIGIIEPMLCSAGSAQTAFPNFSPGPGNEFAADVTSAITGAGAISIGFESNGTTAQAGQLPKDTQYRLIKSGVDVTEQATWAVSTSTGGVTATVGNTTGTRGLVTVSAMTTVTGALRVTATLGVARPYDVTVSKTIAAAPPTAPTGATGGTNNTDTSLTTVNATVSTSPNLISDELTVTLGSSVTQARVSVAFDHTLTGVTGGATQTLSAKAQWWNGSAWADVNAYVASNPAFLRYNEGTVTEPSWINDPGNVSFDTVQTGLTAGSTQKFRVVCYISAGRTTSVANLYGSVTVKGDGS